MKAAFSSIVLCLATLAGCGDDDGRADTGPSDAGGGDARADSRTPDTGGPDTGTTDGGGTIAVRLSFAAKVGDLDFACGDSYDDIGTTGATITANDFRFYVHDVRLVNEADEEVAVTIEGDGMWALDGTVLLDFENGASGCDGGNPELHVAIDGTIPEGSYDGVRFRMGVPFAQNHNVDAATAAAPLNLTSMWWNWQGGYKFLRIDGTTPSTGFGWRQHIGSTGCDGSMAGGVTMCTNPNVVDVSLDGFDPATSTIVADLAALLSDTDITENTDSTPPGCMASLDDPDCAGTFASLGLDHMGVAGGAQTFFRIE